MSPFPPLSALVTIYNEMYMKILHMIMSGFILLNGCVTSYLGEKDVANIRERWMAVAGKCPDVLDSRIDYIPGIIHRDCPEAGIILEKYHEVTVIEPRKRGELYLTVLDEQGHTLEGVEAEVRTVLASHPLAMEPVVLTKQIIINREVRIPWRHWGSSLEVELSKDRYRTITAHFSPEPSQTMERLYEARARIYEGYILPPLKQDGPVRVVIPPEVNWEPACNQETHWQHPSCTPDRKKWPTKIKGDELIVLKSDSPNMVTAPVRGTYVLADREGRVVLLKRADKGNPLGFWKTEKPGWIGWADSGTSRGFDLKDGPYTLRLWREAKPITLPATQPASP